MRELLAGVSLLAIAIPLNIGYAQIAGLPATAGLYALVLPTIIYALTVSSRQLVVSVDAVASALVASSLAGLAIAGSADYATLALAQAIIVGIMFLLLAMFRLGFLANFRSKPILLGFVVVLVLNIMVSQVAKVLGVHVDSVAEFTEKLGQLIMGLNTISVFSLLIVVGSVLVLLGGRRLHAVVPWALVVLVAATAFVLLTNDQQAGVAVLREVPAGPPRLSWPVIEWSMWLVLIPSALALTMVSTAEGLLLSRPYAEKRGYKTSPNRDFLAFGLGNIAAGASASFTVGSSTSRTAAVDQAGSRTQLPSLVMALGTLLLLLFGTGILADIPSPAIGAVVSVAIIPLLGIREFEELWRKYRCEFTVGVFCFLVTLFVGSIMGIIVAFVLTLVNMAKRASNPAVDVLQASGDLGESLLDDVPAGSVSAPGVIVIRLAAPLFFANSDMFVQAERGAIESAGPDLVDHLVIDMEAMTDIDVTGAESFAGLQTWLSEHQVAPSFSRVRPEAKHRLRRLELLDEHTVFPTNRAAIAALSRDNRLSDLPPGEA
ncbi:SulP family inorganic anion transporter [Paeniglutamicibacter cryotolerans]|uniref:High affinity sulfate transporter 1 n=1 Tax=Paeniglutamicibacter cryotolerans TaxID=670079 RepID=A0A839QN96_9MICC|nr:SulP family inorganic anion transporter [Paeniglutamicibacter cryotolerans]MBB2995476.1 high affinity sulfate transporter 1 [Paeniglutamicibacter cryotolerans]